MVSRSRCPLCAELLPRAYYGIYYVYVEGMISASYLREAFVFVFQRLVKETLSHM